MCIAVHTACLCNVYLCCRAGEALVNAGRIAAATGAALYCENAFARLDRGAGLPDIQRLPYFPHVGMLSRYHCRIGTAEVPLSDTQLGCWEAGGPGLVLTPGACPSPVTA